VKEGVRFDRSEAKVLGGVRRFRYRIHKHQEASWRCGSLELQGRRREMYQKSLKENLSGAASRSYGEERGLVFSRTPDDAAGDSEAVRRYRRFFQTHDLDGLSRGRPRPDR
jgi:hypothetical protein